MINLPVWIFLVDHCILIVTLVVIEQLLLVD